jgi:hypothetical protein
MLPEGIEYRRVGTVDGHGQEGHANGIASLHEDIHAPERKRECHQALDEHADQVHGDDDGQRFDQSFVGRVHGCQLLMQYDWVIYLCQASHFLALTVGGGLVEKGEHPDKDVKNHQCAAEHGTAYARPDGQLTAAQQFVGRAGEQGAGLEFLNH